MIISFIIILIAMGIVGKMLGVDKKYVWCHTCESRIETKDLIVYTHFHCDNRYLCPNCNGEDLEDCSNTFLYG